MDKADQENLSTSEAEKVQYQRHPSLFARCVSGPDCEASLEDRPDSPLSSGKLFFARQVTAPAVLQVSDWHLRQDDMTVLYEGSSTSFTNSKVMRSRAFSSRSANARSGSTTPSSGAMEVDVAVKSVALDDDGHELAMMRRECEMLSKLGQSHPHITGALGFGECDSEMLLLMRFASEGDLHHFAPSGSCFEEVQANRFAQQMLSALAYCEEHRIVHTGMKPQNILITLAEGRLLAQLTDFGHAQIIPEDQTFLQLEDEIEGSYGYIPPEVKHKKQLGFAADLFALGVNLFRLLSSYDPFYPASAVDSELLFDSVCWDPLSKMSQDLVTQLLAPDPSTRGSAEVLKGHPWFTVGEASLVGKPRAAFAPLPRENVDFHTLEDAARVWSSLQPM